MRTLRVIARGLGRVLALAVIVVSAILLVLGLAVPRLGGAFPYAVLTGSMEPHLPAGTLVVVRPTDPDELKVGSVITYQLRSGEPEVVTHRVVQTGVSAGSGERVFKTRGDANSAADPEWVRAVQVRGVVWYGIPFAGYLTQWATGDQRINIVNGVAGALGVYAIWMFSSAAWEKWQAIRARRPASASTRGTTSREEPEGDAGRPS